MHGKESDVWEDCVESLTLRPLCPQWFEMELPCDLRDLCGLKYKR